MLSSQARTGLNEGGSCSTDGASSDSFCASNACINGFCAAGKAGADKLCNADVGCPESSCGCPGCSNSALPCCTSGDKQGTLGSQARTGLSEGSSYSMGRASSDSACASSACINGLCAAGKASVNELHATGAGCINSACGRPEHGSGALACHASGNKLDMSNQLVHVGLPDGRPCSMDEASSDSVCASGVCCDGACSSGEVNAACGSDVDCLSRACGEPECNNEALACCASGKKEAIGLLHDARAGAPEGGSCGAPGSRRFFSTQIVSFA